MMSNGKQQISLENFADELDAIFVDFIKSSFEKRQEAVQAGAEVYKSAIENNTQVPIKTGELRQSWAIKDKYPDNRYVGNTKKVNGGGKTGIPLTNILFAAQDSKYYGLMDRVYEENESKIFDAIKNKLK